jgi:hypothetical protein
VGGDVWNEGNGAELVGFATVRTGHGRSVARSRKVARWENGKVAHSDFHTVRPVR